VCPESGTLKARVSCTSGRRALLSAPHVRINMKVKRTGVPDEPHRCGRGVSGAPSASVRWEGFRARSRSCSRCRALRPRGLMEPTEPRDMRAERRATEANAAERVGGQHTAALTHPPRHRRTSGRGYASQT